MVALKRGWSVALELSHGNMLALPRPGFRALPTPPRQVSFNCEKVHVYSHSFSERRVLVVLPDSHRHNDDTICTAIYYCNSTLGVGEEGKEEQETRQAASMQRVDAGLAALRRGWYGHGAAATLTRARDTGCPAGHPLTGGAVAMTTPFMFCVQDNT